MSEVERFECDGVVESSFVCGQLSELCDGLCVRYGGDSGDGVVEVWFKDWCVGRDDGVGWCPFAAPIDGIDDCVVAVGRPDLWVLPAVVSNEELLSLGIGGNVE